MKKAFLLASLIIPAMLIANFASVLNNKSGNPIITWSPEFIEEKISPANTSEINVVFENKKDLQNIELWLTPELKDFITFTPEYFDSVSADAKNFIHLEISIPAETPLGVYNGTLHVRAEKRTIPQTLKITLEVTESLNEENLTTMLETHKEAVQNFNEWLEIYGREEARQMTADWLKSQSNVQETGISEDGTIWILFTNSIEGDIKTYPSGTLGGDEGNNLISPSSLQKMVNKINAAVFSGLISQPFITSNQPIVVGNDRVIVFDPFLDELGEESPQSYVYSKISPLTDATYLKNEEVTIDVIKTIYGYGVVNITTHGRLHRDVVGFLSGEKVTPINIFFHIGDLRNKRLSIGWQGLTPYYEVLPAFITNYAEESYPNSVIYIGACQSLKNSTMANVFLGREALTYFGFTKTTSALFNREKAKELFTNLIDKRLTAGEAFANGLDPYWPGPDPEYGYESEAAKFDMAGESNLVLLLALPQWSSPVDISNTFNPSFHPAIAVDNLGNIHIVWEEELSPFNNEIFYIKRDGNKWSAPVNISNTRLHSGWPDISIDALNRVHVVWMDDTTTNYNYDIFYTMWDGSGWSVPINITNTVKYSGLPAITSDKNNNPHVVWMDLTLGNIEILYTKKEESGWLFPINISNNIGESRSPDIISDDINHLHVVWYDLTPGNYEIFYTMWDGYSWSTSLNVSNSITFSGNPTISADKFNRIHMAWEEFIPSNFEIFYKVRNDVWSASVNISNTPGSSRLPSITTDATGYPHLTWQDFSLNNEIFYSRWNGIKWSIFTNISNNLGHSQGPDVISDIFNHLHVVWSDFTPGNYEIFYSTK